MDAKKFQNMVRTIVAEELKKQLPAVVESVLTERYLRKIVSENAPAPQRGSSLSETLAGDEDPSYEDQVPEQLDNDHDGIYHTNPIKKESREGFRKDVMNRLMGSDNPMAWIYEDVNPIAAGSRPVALGESQQKFGESGVPLNKLPGLDMKKMQDMNRRLNEKKAPDQTNAAEERRLANLRAALDVPVKPTPRVK